MKRLLPLGLPVLLILSSLGNVFAAAFCPGGVGRACCLAKNAQVHQHSFVAEAAAAPALAMTDGPMHEMAGHCSSHSQMRHAAARGSAGLRTVEQGKTIAPSKRQALPQQPRVGAEQFDQSGQSCTHCFNHSRPGEVLSAVAFTYHPGKQLSFVPLSPVKHLAAPLVFSHAHLPRDHAPPGTRLPRYLVMNVFLI